MKYDTLIIHCKGREERDFHRLNGTETDLMANDC